MAFDTDLDARLTDIVQGKPDYVRRRMFGGVAWMLAGNMCVGVYKEFLILRVGIEQADVIIDHHNVIPMDLTGTLMKGWVMVAPDAIVDDSDLDKYVDIAEKFVKSLPPK